MLENIKILPNSIKRLITNINMIYKDAVAMD